MDRTSSTADQYSKRPTSDPSTAQLLGPRSFYYHTSRCSTSYLQCNVSYRSPVSVNFSLIHAHSVRLRPHIVNVSLSHEDPPYLGEEYPISVKVTNTDDRELDIVVDAILYPSEVEFACE